MNEPLKLPDIRQQIKRRILLDHERFGITGEISEEGIDTIVEILGSRVPGKDRTRQNYLREIQRRRG